MDLMNTGSRLRALGLVLALAVTSCWTFAAHAQTRASTADEAASIVRDQTGGRILGVRAQGKRFLVKVAQGGKVRVVAVPAN